MERGNFIFIRTRQGLDAVLSQEEEDKQMHLIFIAMKSLSGAEKSYHVTDLEALAVVCRYRIPPVYICRTNSGDNRSSTASSFV